MDDGRAAAAEERPAGYIYGTGAQPAPRRCPACGAGVLRVKASRHGPFVGCGAWPACGYRRALACGSDAAARAGPKRLGTDPASELAVSLRRGPHGHCIELAGAGEAKPRSMSVPGGMDPDGIGLEAALKPLGLAREVGAHPAQAGSRSWPASAATVPGCGTARPTRRYPRARTC